MCTAIWVVAKYQVDNTFNVVKMSEKCFLAISCNFLIWVTEKAGKKGEKSNEKAERYSHKA